MKYTSYYFFLLVLSCFSVHAQSDPVLDPGPDPGNTTYYYEDRDCDGYGAGAAIPDYQITDYNICYSLDNQDCNDDDASVYPKIWFYDADGDGYGTSTSTTMSCTQPTYYVNNSDDCNDYSAASYPMIWYQDNDKDGFGTNLITQSSCYQPTGFVNNSNDCDDNNAGLNPNTKWFIDTNNDGIISDEDGQAVFTQCLSPGGNYISKSDSKNNWVHSIQYDVFGNLIGVSRTYFDDLGKPNVSLSKNFVQNKIWGTETVYDTFNRDDKTSFIAPSPLNSFEKIQFFKSASEISATAIPENVSVTATVVQNQNFTAKQTINASSTINSGLNVTFTANAITLSPGFNVVASSGSIFQTVISTPANDAAQLALSNYYSDNNALEPYQATASDPFFQNNYDKLNPGNIINVTGGNKIDGEWKTGYSYTVHAAQEMYYVYGTDYYDGPVVSNKEEVITKYTKSVGIDANGNENVSFTDGEGKLLAAARAGGPTSYPVVSLISTQGFIDVHIPKGINSNQISLIGDVSRYKVYDLKTGTIAITPLTGGNAYRVQALTAPTTESKTYIANGVPTYDNGALGIAYSVNYYDYSVNVYNKTEQLIKSVQPNGYVPSTTILPVPAHMLPTATAFISTFTYNDQGQVKQITTSDEGTSKFVYRNDGQVRYSQTALQSDTKVSYTQYDTYARAIESGVVLANWSSASANPDGELVAGLRSEQTFTIYDDADNNTTSVALPANLSLSSVLTNSGINAANYQQNNLFGNVAITYTKPGTDITAITWYSYDIYGRSEWIVQYNEGIGAKTIHYEYDYKGNLKKVLYQKDKSTEIFVHRYTYDVNDVLKKVETAADNNYYTTHADYTYYHTGELKRINIAQGLQGIDYVYTLSGALKSINHPSLDPAKDPGGDANDIFGITLDYYSGDYLRTGSNINTSTNVSGSNQDFNGNIKAARWANKGIAEDYSGGVANQKGYLYQYNNNNWLTNATFGTATASSIAPSNKYSEGGLTYDPNGNIKTLQRSNNTGAVVDDLTYNYNSKNQLNSLTENAVPTADATDIENQMANNYVYDAIGQLITNVKENTNYSYNTQGLVTEVRIGASPIVKFYYNERGHRIKKESFNSSNGALIGTDYYILDISGNAMSIYSKTSSTIIQKELPIFGLSRLGVYNKTDYTSYYEITDHLGNVRAVITDDVLRRGTASNVGPSGNDLPVVVSSYADYYPFGEQLPFRNTTSNYRYAFQGQEKDPETGMEAFQLRLWDGRIGRWLSPDPYGQYASPYLGMGNNPVGMIDPDGGFAEGPGDPGKGFFARLWGRITGNRSSEYQNIPKEKTYFEQLDEVVVTRSNPHHISKGSNSHLIGALGYTANYGALGRTTNGGLALPRDFGSWNSAGSDGRQWIGCMSCHGSNGAYRTLAYNSESTKAGQWIAALLPLPGFKGMGAAKGLVQAEKVSGSYLLMFQSGKFYAGKGLPPRMMKSIHRIETTYGDKLLDSQYFPASSASEAFINEHNIMMQFGGPKSFNPLSPTYNKIFSPGKKLGGF